MKVIIATGNPGKLREFSRILNPLGFEVCSQSEAGFTGSVEETGTTFAENAFLKRMLSINNFTALPLRMIADWK